MKGSLNVELEPNEPTRCHAQSSDLTPIDFFGHVKTLFMTCTLHNLQKKIRRRITDAFAIIGKRPLGKVTNNLRKSSELLCVEKWLTFRAFL